MSEPIVAGIDAAEQTLYAAWGEHCRPFTNDDAGHEALIAQLRPHAVELIVMETTGGHETACACALQAAGFCVAVVNLRQARAFATSMGYLARTGRIDARVLQRIAAQIVRQPDRDKHIKAMPQEQLEALQALVVRRRQLVEMFIAERDRLAISHRAARPGIDALVRAIRAQLDAIDKQMARHIAQHHAALLLHFRNTSTLSVSRVRPRRAAASTTSS